MAAFACLRDKKLDIESLFFFFAHKFTKGLMVKNDLLSGLRETSLFPVP